MKGACPICKKAHCEHTADDFAAEIERLRGELDEWRQDGFTREAFESMQRRAERADAAFPPAKPELRVHVDATIGSDDDGDGGADRPYQTIRRALEAVQPSEPEPKVFDSSYKPRTIFRAAKPDPVLTSHTEGSAQTCEQVGETVVVDERKATADAGVCKPDGVVYTKDIASAHSFSEFRKKVTTRACRLVGPFSVQTREGVLHCDDGWLALDASGFPYPIAADEFDRLYEPVPDAGDGIDEDWIYVRGTEVGFSGGLTRVTALEVIELQAALIRELRTKACGGSGSESRSASSSDSQSTGGLGEASTVAVAQRERDRVRVSVNELRECLGGVYNDGLLRLLRERGVEVEDSE